MKKPIVCALALAVAVTFADVSFAQAPAAPAPAVTPATPAVPATPTPEKKS